MEAGCIIPHGAATVIHGIPQKVTEFSKRGLGKARVCNRVKSGDIPYRVINIPRHLELFLLFAIAILLSSSGILLCPAAIFILWRF